MAKEDALLPLVATVKSKMPKGMSSVTSADAIEYMYYLKYRYLLLKNKYTILTKWANSSIFD